MAVSDNDNEDEISACEKKDKIRNTRALNSKIIYYYFKGLSIVEETE